MGARASYGWIVKIDTAAIRALRDRLLNSGGVPTIPPAAPDEGEGEHPLAGDAQALALFEATFEGMFIMLCADGVAGHAEKEVLRGAMRELTAGVVRSKLIERMTEEAAARLETEGAGARLSACAQVLAPSPLAAEAAFVLAAVMAYADDEIADEERELLAAFADHLGLSSERTNALLEAIEPTPT